MKIFVKAITLGFAAALVASAAFAQTPAPQAPTMPGAATPMNPAPTASPGDGAVAHSAKSLDCSKQADEKGLHGKARKKFRSDCKHGKGDAAQ